LRLRGRRNGRRIFPGSTVSKLMMRVFSIFVVLGLVVAGSQGATADGVEPEGACAQAVARAVQRHY